MRLNPRVIGVLLAAVLAPAGLVGLEGQQAAGRSAPPLTARLAILAVEDARAPGPDDVRALLTAARSDGVEQQRAAVRALGRLERRDLVVDLVPFLTGRDPLVAAEAASALVLALRGPALPDVSDDRHLQLALRGLTVSGGGALRSRAVGYLPYVTRADFEKAEQLLANSIRSSDTTVEPVRGLEALARKNRKLLPLQDATLERLRAIALTHERANAPELRRNAMAALIAAQGVNLPTLIAALKDDEPEVRRLAALALAGAGSTVDGPQRVDLIRKALSDASPQVRLEALKGWVRRGVPENGCGLVLHALSDEDPNVTLYALDALSEPCKDDPLVTDRLTAEARTPPITGRWQREAHALVALARRAPDRTGLAMPSFLSHGRWQVRMYAARAAAYMDDVESLNRLAQDDNDNVREAALPALRRLRRSDSDDLFMAALARPDYQLIRTAARELKGSGPSQALAAALGTALERVTAEKKETSRDPRMALLERLGEMGTDRDAPWVRPLVRDFDPVVAKAAADLLRQWGSDDVAPAPRLLTHEPLPSPGELTEAMQAVVTMEDGRRFTLGFTPEQAPLTRTRFLRLARSGYYDGLTFHRVVANAFIQGGSPGANEYAGDRLYMRDEVGLALHTRGTVGISTRGRDTGDAQIFINLVDNPFLDYEYTVFARVCGDGMSAVDRIQEGDRIERVQVQPGNQCR